MSDASNPDLLGIRVLTPCRLWEGSYWPNGYGRTDTGGLAHREVWEEAYGVLPPELDVCHHCDTPGCIELTHLFPGTPKDNMLDCVAKGRIGGWARNAYKTECMRGHPFDAANTIWYVGHRGNPARACRTCKRASNREWWRRNRGMNV